MVFQYNPLIHFMEVNARGRGHLHRLAASICSRRASATTSTTPAGSSSSRRSAAPWQPRGFDLDRLDEAAEVHGPRGPLPWAQPIPLPFLWIHGRRDATISVMGSNIYPEDIESVLYRDAAVARRGSHSFMLSVVDDATGTPRPSVAIELADLEGVDDAWRAAAAERLRDGLIGAQHRLPLIGRRIPGRDAADRRRRTRSGEGPFAGDATRIKQRRISAG